MPKLELIENFPTSILDDLPFNGNKLKSNNMVYNIVIDHYFIKVLNNAKIKMLYKGNYFELWRRYYEEIKELVDLNRIYALVELDDGRYVEVSEKLDKEKFLDMGSYSNQKWDTMFELYQKIFHYINSVALKNKYTSNIIGLESAIWNFNTDGKLFDIDPPRILIKGEDTSFARHDDINHIKRTIYRNFSDIGMKLNLISTFILGLKDHNFVINDLPFNYKNILINTLYDNISLEDKSFITKYIYGEGESSELFEGHPLKILKKMYRE